MKKLIQILLVALVHCLVAGFLFISSFHMMLDPNDHPSTLYQQLASPISKVLLYPLFIPLSEFTPQSFPGLLGYIPMYLNSVIWAIGIVFIRDKLRSKNMIDK